MTSIEKIKKDALIRHIPIIMDETLEVVKKILIEVKPKRILEIGTAVGYSAIMFSKYLEEDATIDTIERDEEMQKEAEGNFKDLNLNSKINLYKGDAVEVLEKLTGPYDLVFIDAAKGKYPIFLSHALRMLSNNGIIIADNVLYKGYVLSDYNKHKQRTAVRGLREFLKLLEANKDLNTEILDVGDGLTISKKIK